MILKDRTIVVYVPNLESLFEVRIKPTIDAQTITMSKIFHGSLKYLILYPMVLIVTSLVKIRVKMRLSWSN